MKSNPILLNGCISAMLCGCVTLTTIREHVKYFSPLQVLTALNELKRNGYIIYSNDNMAKEYCYKVTEKGFKAFVK